MDQDRALNFGIVGGGPGCKAIMGMIFAEKLSELRMKVVGVASTNAKAVGYLYAKEKGLFTTKDYRDLYELKDRPLAPGSPSSGTRAIADLLARDGISAEVIDPRTLVPLDKETLIRSVAKMSLPRM